MLFRSALLLHGKVRLPWMELLGTHDNRSLRTQDSANSTWPVIWISRQPGLQDHFYSHFSLHTRTRSATVVDLCQNPFLVGSQGGGHSRRSPPVFVGSFTGPIQPSFLLHGHEWTSDGHSNIWDIAPRTEMLVSDSAIASGTLN